MFICSCRAVSSRTIVAAVAAGATTVDDVGRACGAGTECGSCRPTIAALLEAGPQESGLQEAGTTRSRAGSDPPLGGGGAGPVR